MEEIYNKIIKGEINIKYLSPVDLVNLEIYLEQMDISLKDMLKLAKDNNINLENKKSQLQSELLKKILYKKDLVVRFNVK